MHNCKYVLNNFKISYILQLFLTKIKIEISLVYLFFFELNSISELKIQRKMSVIYDVRLVILLAIVILVLFRKIWNRFYRNLKIDRESVFVIVLGDIGRSPRMNYHALSLVKLGYKVTIIGYEESKQMYEIKSNPNILIIPLNTFPKHLHGGLLLH